MSTETREVCVAPDSAAELFEAEEFTMFSSWFSCSPLVVVATWPFPKDNIDVRFFKMEFSCSLFPVIFILVIVSFLLGELLSRVGETLIDTPDPPELPAPPALPPELVSWVGCLEFPGEP